jgi:hypothetical protein
MRAAMRSSRLLSVAFLLLGGVALAWADRPVTEEEKVKLAAAVAAQGCSGGKMEFDDGKYEVDNAVCSDGRRYDLDFNTKFELVKKEPEDRK